MEKVKLILPRLNLYVCSALRQKLFVAQAQVEFLVCGHPATLQRSAGGEMSLQMLFILYTVHITNQTPVA